MKRLITAFILSAAIALASDKTTNGTVEIAGRFYYLQPVHHSVWKSIGVNVYRYGLPVAIGYYTGKVVAHEADKDFTATANKAFGQFQSQLTLQFNQFESLQGAATHQPGQLR